MATGGSKAKLARKVSIPNSDFDLPRVPVGVAVVRKSLGEDIVGWVAACILIAFLLPLGAMLYLDILDAKHEVKQQLEKVEKLRRQIESQQREKNK